MRVRFARFFRFSALIVLLLIILGPLSTSIHSASGLTRLTTSGDITAFEWSPRADALYATRSAGTRAINSSQSQTITDLYHIAVANGASTLIMPNANFVAPAPSGNQLAFLALADTGAAELRVLDLNTNQSRDIDNATWGATPQWTLTGDQIIYNASGRAVTKNVSDNTTRVLAPLPSALGFFASPRGDRFALLTTDGLHVNVAGQDTIGFQNNGSARAQNEMHWSSDGTRLAFVVTRNGVDPELWLWDANGARELWRGEMDFVAGVEWSPDDSHLIFTRTPMGSSIASASDIWRLAVDGTDLHALTRNGDEESAPQYSPDGTQIAFLRGGDLWLMQLNALGLPIADMTHANVSAPAQEIFPPPALPVVPNAVTSQLTPPVTIRVKHDQYNTCRNVAVGQIDTYDFETYVKRVVPAEVYSSWPSESLKTQAVAARSYAWFYVLQHTTWDYDVTDSTAYQYMCDAQYATTDTAVDATRGQYGAYNGTVIFAAYGADNGDPTLTNSWGNPYLLAVDDPVRFTRAVSGNGIGMSQWGAHDWAYYYSWNYQQILTHYYSGITIESPAGGAPDTTAPIGAMAAPWSNWGMTSNHAYLSANASDDSSGVASVDFIAHYFDGTTTQDVTITHLTNGANGWNYLADLTSIPDQTGLTVTPNVHDVSGNAFSGNALTDILDRVAPTGTVSAPSATNVQTVTLTLNASDTGPGGLQKMAFSNNWIWEGENQAVQNASGTVVNDPDALNGQALRGLVGTNPAGAWYGPYTNILSEGKQYRAYFRLKTDDVTNTSEIARLDVADNSGTNIFGIKRMRGSDFRAANVYQEFYVDFDFEGTVTNGLEFRVAYRATGDLWLDRIIVVSYPISYATTAQWTLPPGNGSKTVQAKFIDGAGNISADAIANIVLGATPTPTNTATSTPTATATPILTPQIWLPLITR